MRQCEHISFLQYLIGRSSNTTAGVAVLICSAGRDFWSVTGTAEQQWLHRRDSGN